jgi:hypothetical protein
MRSDTAQSYNTSHMSVANLNAQKHILLWTVRHSTKTTNNERCTTIDQNKYATADYAYTKSVDVYLCLCRAAAKPVSVPLSLLLLLISTASLSLVDCGANGCNSLAASAFLNDAELANLYSKRTR